MDSNSKRHYQNATGDQSTLVQDQTDDKDNFHPNLECGDQLLANEGQTSEHNVRHEERNGPCQHLPDEQILTTTDHVADVTTKKLEIQAESKSKYKVDAGGQMCLLAVPYCQTKPHTQINSLCEHAQGFSTKLESEWSPSGPKSDRTPQPYQVDPDQNDRNINQLLTEETDSSEHRTVQSTESPAKMCSNLKLQDFVSEFDNLHVTKVNWSQVDLEIEHQKSKVLYRELYRMTLLHKQVNQQCHSAVHMAHALQQKLDEEIKSHTEDINQIRTMRLAHAAEREMIVEEMEALQKESEMKQTALLVEIEKLQKVPVLNTQAQHVSETRQEGQTVEHASITRQQTPDISAQGASMQDDKQLIQTFKAEMGYFREMIMKEVKELKTEVHDQTMCSHLSSKTLDLEKTTLVFERHVDAPGQVIHHLFAASLPKSTEQEESVDHQKLPMVQRSIWKRLRNFLGIKSHKKQKFWNVKL